MSAERKFWDQKTLCIVTGASQGIGQCLAVNFAKRFAANSCLLLIARSEKGLNETKELILKANRDINVVIEPQDLSKPDINNYKNIFSKVGKDKYELYILIHNAGSEGNGQLTSEMSNLNEWTTYMSLNLFSVTMLTNAFLEQFTDGEKTIINITSLAAIKPIKGLGYYCVGKASREMYFNTLAEENPHLNILNYAPGPIATEMIDRVVEKLKVDETKNVFVEMQETSTLITAPQTTDRLISILTSGFASGSRIDFFNAQ